MNHADRRLARYWLPLVALPLALVVASAGYSQPAAGLRFERLSLFAAPRAAAADVATESDDPSEAKFPGGAALKTDPEQQRLLKRAEQCVADGRVDLAVILWQKVLDEAGDTLMTHDGRTYVSLSEEVERILAGLEPQALATYRITADGEAQAILAKAGSEHEEPALAEVVRRYFLSSTGDDAAYKLGCLALDRYDFVGAARLFSRILERHPDPSIPRGEILMRLAIASARVADREAATSALADIEKLAASQQPRRALLAQVTAHIEQAATKSAVADRQTDGWHMTLGSASRNGHMPSLPSEATSRTLTELWVQESGVFAGDQTAVNPWGGFDAFAAAVSGRRPRGAQQATPISREQLISQWRQNGWRPTPELLFDGGRVYVKTPDVLQAYDTAADRDERVWESAWANSYQLDDMSQMLLMMAANMGYGNASSLGSKPKSAAEIMLFGDRIHQSMSIAHGAIYSIEGKRATKEGTSRPAKPAGLRVQWGVAPRRVRTNWLAAYDAKSGKARWHRAASDEDKEGSQDVGFLAAPVPFGELLLAPVTDGGAVWIYALASSDGATVWKSYLCDEPSGGCSPWSPVYVAVDGRDAYVTCGAGVVFAIDAVSGGVRWAVRYARDASGDHRMQQYGQPNLNMLNLNGWDEDVVIPQGRTLVVLSSDSDKLVALDRRSGQLLWESPRTSPFGHAVDYCLGVNGRGLFVAGKNIVRRYDIPSGRLVWEKEIDESFGRGVLTADAVHVPVKDSIVTLELDKGQELRQVGVSLTTDDPVGNLYSDGEKLWVAGAGRVYAMTNLEHRLSLLADKIAAGDAEAQLDRMRLYARQEKFDLVRADLLGAYGLLQRQKSTDEAGLHILEAVQAIKLPQQQPLHTLEVVAELFVTKQPSPVAAKELKSRQGDILSTAMNALRQQKPRSTVSAVVAVAPLLEQDYLSTLAGQTIEAAASAADKETLLAAVQGRSPVAQTIALAGLAKVAPEVAEKECVRLLKSDDDGLRLAASRTLLNAGERSAFDTLLSLLESPTARIRARSHQTLRAVSGESIGFASEGKAEERAKSVAAWKEWITTKGPTAELRLPLPASDVLLGRMLYVSHVHSMVRELDADHKERWSIKVPNPWGCQGLPNGHRLIAAYAQNMVIEYDDAGKEVWRKDRLPSPPYSVQRLENGNTFVACADVQQVLEISPDGSVKTQTIQGRPMCARRLDNGNTLIALQQNNRVVEIDRDQKVIWEARNLNGPSFVQRLENGNTLVVQMYNGQVVEVDTTGEKLVWQSRVPLVNPCSAQRLPSGNTLVADNNGVHELSPDGQKVIWQQRQNNVTGLSYY